MNQEVKFSYNAKTRQFLYNFEEIAARPVNFKAFGCCSKNLYIP